MKKNFATRALFRYSLCGASNTYLFRGRKFASYTGKHHLIIMKYICQIVNANETEVSVSFIRYIFLMALGIGSFSRRLSSASSPVDVSLSITEASKLTDLAPLWRLGDLGLTRMGTIWFSLGFRLLMC